MADIDVSAVGLSSPPTSAPKTSYTPGIRVRNNGIHARSASGFLQVYDLVSGVLLDQWGLESSSIDPGEEGIAYADGYWNNEELEVGSKVVFTGYVTCDGDMVSGNNPLPPVIVTTTAAAPPPPPPVEAHSSQHEEGGSDELNVDGLHGTLAEGQPFSPHASAHQDGGSDELSLSGMSGLLTTPQIPQTHGNERHVQDFALSAELTNHINDDTPHNFALAAPIPTKGGAAPSLGPVVTLAPSEHQHGGDGAIGMDRYTNIAGGGLRDVGIYNIEDGALRSGDVGWAEYLVAFDIDLTFSEAIGPGSVATLYLYAGPDQPGLILRGFINLTINGGVIAGKAYARINAYCFTTSTEVEMHALTCCAGAGVDLTTAPVTISAATDRNQAQLWKAVINLAATTTMDGARSVAVLHCGKVSG